MLFADAILLDTSAVIALHCPSDQYHVVAKSFFSTTEQSLLVALNVTAHESYTRARYNSTFPAAIEIYDFLKGQQLFQLTFTPEHEQKARQLLEQFREHRVSFHDALCAVVMKQVGIYRVFTFDRHFYILGFEVLPGCVR